MEQTAWQRRGMCDPPGEGGQGPRMQPHSFHVSVPATTAFGCKLVQIKSPPIQSRGSCAHLARSTSSDLAQQGAAGSRAVGHGRRAQLPPRQKDAGRCPPDSQISKKRCLQASTSKGAPYLRATPPRKLASPVPCAASHGGIGGAEVSGACRQGELRPRRPRSGVSMKAKRQVAAPLHAQQPSEPHHEGQHLVWVHPTPWQQAAACHGAALGPPPTQGPHREGQELA